jgi:hypothetical protein
MLKPFALWDSDGMAQARWVSLTYNKADILLLKNWFGAPAVLCLGDIFCDRCQAFSACGPLSFGHLPCPDGPPSLPTFLLQNTCLSDYLDTLTLELPQRQPLARPAVRRASQCWTAAPVHGGCFTWDWINKGIRLNHFFVYCSRAFKARIERSTKKKIKW